jgi:hypothetical protein
MSQEIGVFRGTVLRQVNAVIGGARSVFAKFKGLKNELVYPFNGGLIKNPPKGQGFKIFAGDLMEYRTNDSYAKPEIYLLKTYQVESVSGTTVNIVKDEYKHVPFVGDILGVAPDEIGGEMTSVTITSVRESKIGDTKVWSCTFSGTLTASKGDVLVEADGDGKMLVQNINAFADSDMDMPYIGATNALTDFDNAKYIYTPAVGGAHIYISKMSPLPECVKKVNYSSFNGLFALKSIM